MEQRAWNLEFRWIKPHAGLGLNELAVQRAKVAARKKNFEECYKNITKCVVMSEQSEEYVKWWQTEWTEKSIVVITKHSFLNREEATIDTNATPNFTALVK